MIQEEITYGAPPSSIPRIHEEAKCSKQVSVISAHSQLEMRGRCRRITGQLDFHI